MEARKAPGMAPKLDEKAKKLLVEDLEQAVGHPLPEGRVPFCRLRGLSERTHHLPDATMALSQPKKRPKGLKNQTSSRPGWGYATVVPGPSLCYNGGWDASLPPTCRPLWRGIKAHICPHRNVL